MIKGGMVARRRSCEQQERQTCSRGLGHSLERPTKRFDLTSHYLSKAPFLPPSSPHNLPTFTHVVSNPLFSLSIKPGSSQPTPLPPSVSLSADSTNSRSYIPTHTLPPLSPIIIPWISTGRPRKQIHFFPQMVLLRSHSIVLDHYGELLAAHSLRAKLTLVDFTTQLPGLFRSR
jgi:hypothetical protein